MRIVALPGEPLPRVALYLPKELEKLRELKGKNVAAIDLDINEVCSDLDRPAPPTDSHTGCRIPVSSPF
jgi:hypothetical protein